MYYSPHHYPHNQSDQQNNPHDIIMSRYRSNLYENQRFDYVNIINRILEHKNKQKPIKLVQKQLNEIISSAKHIFYEQPIMLELQGPVKIVGNINGHLSELISIFKMSGYPGDINYLFLGDYVDRGTNSIEVLTLLLCYKIRFPEHIFLLRGHHQTASVNRCFGFYDQCKERVGVQIWRSFNQMFNSMPLCAVIQQKIFCVHGGLSPQLETINQISRIQRPLEITNNGIALDLLWSDPQPTMSGWQQSQRGMSYNFGLDVCYNFLKNNNLQLLVRSHQVVQDGYEFILHKNVVTIFSIPNYLGEYQNYGAVMVVEENLKCSFEIIKPKFKHKKDIYSELSNNPFKKE